MIATQSRKRWMKRLQRIASKAAAVCYFCGICLLIPVVRLYIAVN